MNPHSSNGDQGPTITALNKPPARSQCVALVPGTHAHFTHDVTNLLRQRLRIAALIALTGFGLFFMKNILVPADTERSMIFHALVVGTIAILSSLLFSPTRWSLRDLRVMELVLFGSMAAFFLHLQYVNFNHGQFITWAKDGYQDRVLTLGVAANSFRWWMLIVLYGTFIPNTWRRCAWVTISMALTPIVLTLGLCAECKVMGPYLYWMLFDMTVMLGLAAAITIFGSYKINVLQQEAFEARKLGQYILHRKLGAGGMGEVYLAEHTLLRRSCAIKLIRPDQAFEPDTLSRFEREVQAMATLTHWNTVEVYDYGHTEDGTFYYVMEYLPGLNLQDMVERHGPLPPGRAIHFLRQVCAALREAHGIGLIHRDIKPSNVIICERGNVYDVAKLLDFGVVQGFGSREADMKLTWKGAVLGSPPFMAPEQALGKPTSDVRSDIYGLGGLLYFLLTGQPPFVRETTMAILMAHVHDAVVPPRELRPEIPPDLEEISLRCLSKRAEDRYADIDELDRALQDCVSADLWDQERAVQWWHEQFLSKERELVRG